MDGLNLCLALYRFGICCKWFLGDVGYQLYVVFALFSGRPSSTELKIE